MRPCVSEDPAPSGEEAKPSPRKVPQLRLAARMPPCVPAGAAVTVARVQPQRKRSLQDDRDRGHKETIMSSSSFVTSSVSVFTDSECWVCPLCRDNAAGDCARHFQWGRFLCRPLCHREKEGRASLTMQIKGLRAVAFPKCSLWSCEACRLFCPREQHGIIPVTEETALFCPS